MLGRKMQYVMFSQAQVAGARILKCFYQFKKVIIGTGERQ